MTKKTYSIVCWFTSDGPCNLIGTPDSTATYTHTHTHTLPPTVHSGSARGAGLVRFSQQVKARIACRLYKQPKEVFNHAPPTPPPTPHLMQGPIKCCIIPETSAVWPHPQRQWHGFPLSGRRPVLFAHGWQSGPRRRHTRPSLPLKWWQPPRMPQTANERKASPSRSHKQCFVTQSGEAAPVCQH